MRTSSLRSSGFLIFVGILSCFALDSLNDIVVGKTYHMILTTGDELEGVIDSKTDSSLILESNGTPYTFIKTLIIEYKLVSNSTQKNNQPDTTIGKNFISYEDVQKNSVIGRKLEVHIKDGSVFTGNLISIDDENIKLNINNSSVPVAQSIVDKITILAAQKIDSSTSIKELAPVLPDTLIVKNPETDEYGIAKTNIVLVGKILSENNNTLSFQTLTGAKADFSFDQIAQLFRHSAESTSTDSIKLYAQPLICPQGMILINVPPGKAGRPFFKTCIDKYEFPNCAGSIPQVNVAFDDAQKLCEKQGKRLCTSQEWQWACSGIEGYAYSYGWTFDKQACNTNGNSIEPSGNRNHCTGKFGVFDMVGNVFEWVKAADNNPAAMGGPLSKCQTIATGGGGDPKPQTGLRCCKSN
jgi:hypothetical protein